MILAAATFPANLFPGDSVTDICFRISLSERAETDEPLLPTSLYRYLFSPLDLITGGFQLP